MTSVSANHIILTTTQPVGSQRPQRESNRGHPHQESRGALPTELSRSPFLEQVNSLEDMMPFFLSLFLCKLTLFRLQSLPRDITPGWVGWTGSLLLFNEAPYRPVPRAPVWHTGHFDWLPSSGRSASGKRLKQWDLSVCVGWIVCIERSWQRNEGMRWVEWIIGPTRCVNDAMDESKSILVESCLYLFLHQ